MTGFEHKWRFARKLDSHKLRNAYRIYRSYRNSQRSGIPQMKGLPFSVSIEPTTACNLRCPECPSGLRSFSRPTGSIDQAFFESFIRENHSHLINLTFYFQGEPFIHPRFLDMVAYASSYQIFTSTSTNGHFLTEKICQRIMESGLDRMIISIDGTDQETYASYRRSGELEKVIEGTRTLLRTRKEFGKGPEVVFQFLVVGPNEHQIDEVKSLGEELGVDRVAFKTAQIYDFENGSPLIPQDEQYSRYRQGEDGRYHIKNPLDDQCWKMWHSCVITWDGKVVPCCFDKDASHVMGDLKKDSLETIWQSEPYERFRQAILRSRSEIDICKNCSEGTQVWAD